MKMTRHLLVTLAYLIILSGCINNGKERLEVEQQKAIEEVESDTDQDPEIEHETDENKPDSESENVEGVEGKSTDILSQYTTQEIEYARVWLNFGANPEVNQIYFEVLPAGSPIIPEIEGSAVYPAEVIRLEGGRQVDGAVTYSGNGDGTINMYNVPYNWNINAEVEEAVYIQESEKVIENIETDYIEPLEDEVVSQMIEKLEEKTH